MEMTFNFVFLISSINAISELNSVVVQLKIV